MNQLPMQLLNQLLNLRLSQQPNLLLMLNQQLTTLLLMQELMKQKKKLKMHLMRLEIQLVMVLLMH